jgi:hypothetical protein
MFALVQQNFWRNNHLVKNWLISAVDKVIYFKRTFSRDYKTSLHATKEGGDQLKKIIPFFKHASST